MLFALIGVFRTPAGVETVSFEADLTEHLAQPALHIRLAGTLRNRNGQHIGYMAIMNAPDFAVAEAYLSQSPYFRADRYERIDIVEYSLVVGAGQLGQGTG